MATNTIKHSLTPAGAIMQYAGATEPTDWLFCDGREVSRTVFSQLFAAIGTLYGAGDGSTTFNLPDLRDRVAVGSGGTVPSDSKKQGGSKDAIVPYHRHSVAKVTGGITGGSHRHYKAGASANGYITGSGVGFASWADSYTDYSTHTHDLPAHNTDYVGTSGDATNANLQPYTILNFIIYTGSSN